jgi:hypothetical protein
MIAKAVVGFFAFRGARSGISVGIDGFIKEAKAVNENKKGGVKMNPTLSSIGIARYRRRARDPVKLTALIYLREALISERYEDCADFIAIAKEFGALDAEIRVLLEDPRRHPNS